MKRYLKKYLLYLLCFFVLFACKKDETTGVIKAELSFEFSVTGQLYPVIKNQAKQSLEIIIPQHSSKSDLATVVNTSAQTYAVLNNSPLINQETTVDYTQPVQLDLLSANQLLESWTVNVKSESEAYGLGSVITDARSLAAQHDYYFDQYGTGKYAMVNCGPAVATMALKWADPKFNKSVSAARDSIKPNGAKWLASDMAKYIDAAEVETLSIYLSDIENQVKNAIDRNYALVLCLDMYQIEFNNDPVQKTGKFYVTSHQAWNHFILVKGYLIADGKFYLEIYDPNSEGTTYTLTGEPRGKNRYYEAAQIAQAVSKCWKYALVVAPKGESVKLY